MKKMYRNGLIVVISIFVIICTTWLAIRVEQVRQTVHHHANVAIVIDGERLDLSADKYMEDIGACKTGSQKSPLDRVHLHENNMDTVHVHDDGVTWGHFLANLGFHVTRDTLVLDDGAVVSATDEKQWRYLLNGREVLRPFNTEIFSRDQLLMSYGDATTEELQEQFAMVSDNAEEYNGAYDPGSCQADVKQNFLVKAIVELLDGHDHHSDHE